MGLRARGLLGCSLGSENGGSPLPTLRLTKASGHHLLNFFFFLFLHFFFSLFLLSLSLSSSLSSFEFSSPSFLLSLFFCFWQVPSLYSPSFLLQPMSTIFVFSFCTAEQWYLPEDSWPGSDGLVLVATTQGIALDHLALEARGFDIPVSHRTVTIRESSWQTTTPRTLHRQLTETHTHLSEKEVYLLLVQKLWPE